MKDEANLKARHYFFQFSAFRWNIITNSEFYVKS
jgi:hypothetical protein